jgi:hypothetical protein
LPAARIAAAVETGDDEQLVTVRHIKQRVEK